jgi:DNA-binding FadR family transcriptional regulator
MTTTSATATTTGRRADRPIERVGLLVPVVVEELVNRFVAGVYPEGDKLPFERELVASLGVSRTVVRESLRVLEEKGLVAIAQGKATTVRPRSDWNVLDPVVINALVKHDPHLEVADALIDVRAAIEGALVRRTVASLDDQRLAEVTAAYQGLVNGIEDPARYLRADREFHRVLLRQSGNYFGEWVVRCAHQWTHSYPGPIPADRVELSQQEHQAIFEAVSRRDADAAARAMESHIRGSWEKTKAVLVRAEGA